MLVCISGCVFLLCCLVHLYTLSLAQLSLLSGSPQLVLSHSFCPCVLVDYPFAMHLSGSTWHTFSCGSWLLAVLEFVSWVDFLLLHDHRLKHAADCAEDSRESASNTLIQLTASWVGNSLASSSWSR